MFKYNKHKRKVLKIIRKVFNDEILNQLLAYRNLGYIPNLDNPETFNEKIQWLKLYGKLEELGQYADKYLVREYIQTKIGDKYLIPLLRVFHKKSDIDFENLPNSFIMKASHGSGWNYLVNNLEMENIDSLKKLADSWLSKNYYEETGERNYKLLMPKIVIEEIIGEIGEELDEYKIHCFNGNPVTIQYLSTENGIRKGNFYTTEWELLPFYKGYPNLERTPEKPGQLEQLLDIAKKLSEDFQYVRVDLYLIDNKVYFGELTFTPAGGVSKFSDIKYDKVLGSYFNLESEIIVK